MTHAFNDWRDRFVDLIDAARHDDRLDDADRERLIDFVAREVRRVRISHPERAPDAWSDIGYRRA